MSELRDKIARAIRENRTVKFTASDGYPSVGFATDEELADAVLAVIDLDKVRADAWDEGHESAAMRVPEGVWHDVAAPHPGNPYRKAEQEVAP